MAEENIKEMKGDNSNKNSKLNIYLAASIPMILMIAGFFLVTKFINPHFAIPNANTYSENGSGENSPEKNSKSHKRKGKKQSAIYELGSVIANPIGTEGKRFAKVGICLELSSKSFIKELDLAKSKLQHQLIMILSSKDIDTLTSIEGKSILIEEIKKAMISQLNLTDEDITNVYFSEFIIQ